MNSESQVRFSEKTGHIASTGEIIVYQLGVTLRLEVKVDESTTWLNRQQMAEFFGRDVNTIDKHITNALREEFNPSLANVGSLESIANGIVREMTSVEIRFVQNLHQLQQNGRYIKSNTITLKALSLWASGSSCRRGFCPAVGRMRF